MEELNPYSQKTKRHFRDNYKPQDIIEEAGKDLLIQWNIRYKKFHDDHRFDKYFEKDKGKPDLIISYNDKTALLDWKGNLTNNWRVNEQTIKSYEKLHKTFQIPILICFITLDENNCISERRFAVINSHDYVESKEETNSNKKIIFKNELPIFNKENLLKYVFGIIN